MAISKQEVAEALKPIDPPSAGKVSSSSTSSKSKAGSRKTSSGASIADIKEGLKGTFTLFGTAISYLDDFDGQVITEKAEVMADALIDVAKTNPSVMRILEGLISTGAWSGVITVIGMQVAMPIAVHHSLLPEPLNTYLAQAGDIEVKANRNLNLVPNDDVASQD